MNNFYGNPYDPYSQQEMKTPAASNANVLAFIAEYLGVPMASLDFVKLSEPFVNSGSEVKHACPISLLNIENYELRQLNFYDKATIDIGYCRNCFRVIYYVEKYA